MGSMFRSEEMALCQLFIQPEAAYSSVAELGEIGCVQFRDLCADVNSFQRKFVTEVRRCGEMERILRYIEAELQKDDVLVPDIAQERMPKAPNPREMVDLEAYLEKTETEILQMSQNSTNLKTNFLELTEFKHVLQKASVFFQGDNNELDSSRSDSISNLIPDESATSGTTMNKEPKDHLDFVAGVVPRGKVPAFERMLWRISRGNVFLRQAEIDEPLIHPTTGDEMLKTVFVAFFQGEQLKSRVKKVCSGFRASLYSCPVAPQERQNLLKGVCSQLEDLNMVLNQTHDHRQRVLVTVAKEFQNWMVTVRKMKAIYHTLNMFSADVSQKCFIGECWIPVGDLESVYRALDTGAKACGSSVSSPLNIIETSETPPTFFRTNKFTYGFQVLIDSYGVASYREVNPGLYTIVTFPFLFALMFGDACHGLMVAIFGLYMVLWEKKIMKIKNKGEIATIFFGGRYIILLMGLFSTYTGFIYNDFFSLSANIFGSSWRSNIDNETIYENALIMLDPNTTAYSDDPYPFGMDPVWQVATSNKIVFLNSFKMKLSIIFGVVHMLFGVCLSIVNHVHFRNPIYILLEFLPQVLFLLVLFGYMVALMFIKWVLYGPKNEHATSSTCAPNVLITFINMMLFGDTKVGEGCSQYMFEGQDMLQTVLIVVALLCIPVLLLGKPIYFICCKKKQHSKGETDDVIASPASDGHGGEEDDLMEMFIYQAIHTVEYVLSTVSHAASYLRLWALSLAHSQLSEVAWGRLLATGLTMDIGYGGAILLYVLFAAWATCTVLILIMMEGLSAFLHTLRLHWVEFMSKFYTGTGYLFQPFSFKNILEEDFEEE